MIFIMTITIIIIVIINIFIITVATIKQVWIQATKHGKQHAADTAATTTTVLQLNSRQVLLPYAHNRHKHFARYLWARPTAGTAIREVVSPLSGISTVRQGELNQPSALCI